MSDRDGRPGQQQAAWRAESGGRGGLDAAGRRLGEHAGCCERDHQLECVDAGRGVVRANRVDGGNPCRWSGGWLRYDASRGEGRGVDPGS